MDETDEFLWNNLIRFRFLGNVYKYSNIENGLLCLLNSTLYFKSPLDFNDPKDCDPKLITIGDKYLNQIAKKQGYTRLPIALRTHQGEYVRFKLVSTQKLKDNLLPKTKITCFSMKNDIPDMWELYSAKNTGICIQFDTTDLLKSLPEDLKFNNINGGIFLQVAYPLIAEKFIYKHEGDTATLLKWASSKSKKWEDEREVRFIIPNWFGNSFIISRNSIKAIYLGSEISAIDEERVREACKMNFDNVSFHKCPPNII